MAVPDTDDFTLQNVVTEIDPTTDDLVDCFADADSTKFDSSYSGAKNNLLNFRNYGSGTRNFVGTDCGDGFQYTVSFTGLGPVTVGQVYQWQRNNGNNECMTINSQSGNGSDGILRNNLQRECDDGVHCFD